MTGSTTEPQDPHAIAVALAAISPAELAEEIRSTVRDIYTCAQAWRRSSAWRGDKLSRKGYDTIALVVATLDVTPQPTTHPEVGRLVDTVAPILNAWWISYSGPQKDLADAVERLRHTAMYKVSWVRQARQSLGVD